MALLPRHPGPMRSGLACVLLLFALTPLLRAEEAIAVFEPRRKAVIAAPVNSRVLRIHFERGSSFESKTLLIELDPTEFKAEFEQARARLSGLEAEIKLRQNLRKASADDAALVKAKAEYLHAKAVREAKEKLFTDGSLSTLQIQEVRAAEAVAAANVEIAQKTKEAGEARFALEMRRLEGEIAVARVRVALAQRNLDACRISAPYDGSVERLLVNEHETVQAGQPMIEIIDNRALLARLLAPTRLLDQFKTGRALPIRVMETNETVEGKVAQIGATADPASATIKIWLEVDNAAGRLRGGLRGSVTLPTIPKDSP